MGPLNTKCEETRHSNHICNFNQASHLFPTGIVIQFSTLITPFSRKVNKWICVTADACNQYQREAKCRWLAVVSQTCDYHFMILFPTLYSNHRPLQSSASCREFTLDVEWYRIIWTCQSRVSPLIRVYENLEAG